MSLLWFGTWLHGIYAFTALSYSEGQGIQSSESMLAAVDRINQKYDPHALTIGSLPKKTTQWQGNRDYTSQRLTTRWTDLAKV